METIHPIAQYRQDKGLTLEAFGRLVGVNKAAVCKWEDGFGPSIENAKAIEEATGGALPKHVLRPDVWGTDNQSEGAARNWDRASAKI
jgi:transcriptional regulator with XRE-family HTH domain